MSNIPQNLLTLHQGEERVRLGSLAEIEKDKDLLLHIQITEAVMDVLDVFRQLPKDDEDTQAIKLLGLRAFNAFASATKLILSGYHLFGAQILRDLIETVFLVDLFYTDKSTIKRWRFASTREELEEFKPVNVRKTLDTRDGTTSKKRAELYKTFSELAGHPTMKSVAMLKPLGMDATNGPFFDPTALLAGLSEMGRLAMQVGELFVELGRGHGTEFTSVFAPSANTFLGFKKDWVQKYYPNLANAKPL